jgi:hypothetical protein
MHNYRGFADASVDFHPRLTVLVGPNGSGKSSVLAAVHALTHALYRHCLSGDLAPRGWPRGEQFQSSDFFGANNALELRGELEWLHNEHVEASLSVERTAGVVTEDLQASIAQGTAFLRALSDSYESGDAVPLAVLYGTRRTTRTVFGEAHLSLGSSGPPPPPSWTNAFRPDRNVSGFDFAGLASWFRSREDLENQRRARVDPSYRDAVLERVRRALNSFFQSERVEFDREIGELTFVRDARLLTEAMLSEGERALLALVGDLARRLSFAVKDPATFDTARALVLVDEIELHLHPSWQRMVLPRLIESFPACQFVVTTHSPQVVASVDADCVRVVREFRVEHLAALSRGRDSNTLLESVFAVDSRPSEFAARITEAHQLIDRDLVDEARRVVDDLAVELGDDDPAVIDLRAALWFAEGKDDAAHPKG